MMKFGSLKLCDRERETAIDTRCIGNVASIQQRNENNNLAANIEETFRGSLGSHSSGFL